MHDAWLTVHEDLFRLQRYDLGHMMQVSSGKAHPHVVRPPTEVHHAMIAHHAMVTWVEWVGDH